LDKTELIGLARSRGRWAQAFAAEPLAGGGGNIGAGRTAPRGESDVNADVRFLADERAGSARPCGGQDIGADKSGGRAGREISDGVLCVASHDSFLFKLLSDSLVFGKKKFRELHRLMAGIAPRQEGGGPEALIAAGRLRVSLAVDVAADFAGDGVVAVQFCGSQKGFEYGLVLGHDFLSRRLVCLIE
jgi:hypothetical protein